MDCCRAIRIWNMNHMMRMVITRWLCVYNLTRQPAIWWCYIWRLCFEVYAHFYTHTCSHTNIYTLTHRQSNFGGGGAQFNRLQTRPKQSSFDQGVADEDSQLFKQKRVRARSAYKMVAAKGKGRTGMCCVRLVGGHFIWAGMISSMGACMLWA